jgi:MoaA/NifB/PqqE/SkfB family radical SAM enzyme
MTMDLHADQIQGFFEVPVDHLFASTLFAPYLKTKLSVPAILGEEDRPRRCTAPDRTPTISWDGKITLCSRDVQLLNRVGEVTSSELSTVWRSPALVADRQACERQGVPGRDLCRDCALPWSPNH